MKHIFHNQLKLHFHFLVILHNMEEKLETNGNFTKKYEFKFQLPNLCYEYQFKTIKRITNIYKEKSLTFSPPFPIGK